MIVLEFHVILLIICDCRASIVESRNAKNRAQGGPVREPIKTGIGDIGGVNLLAHTIKNIL